MCAHLVVVESPAKAKTIKRFLGKDFRVEASMGHIRDLPESTLGVDTAGNFTPIYEIPADKRAVVKRLVAALRECDDLWVATDEDREGEAIGWHLTQALNVKSTAAQRIVFHEITEEAIRSAVTHPRTIDMRLVSAQQTRRILDRLVGYTLSPFLWKKVMTGLSAGRVQSVAVRIIVDREREIRAFTPREYWTITVELCTPEKQTFTAQLVRREEEEMVIGSQEEADAVLKDLARASFVVADVEEKEVRRTPPAPFTTSTLQQEAARKLGFSVKQTMVVAQQLYESGRITYMRTDSVNLSEKALAEAQSVIGARFGREYVLAAPRRYKTKSKGAQEAHEAIRPTELHHTPESMAGDLDHQQLKLYTLIWNRMLATQMPAAEFKRVGADITANHYTFRATGQTILFDGFLRVYSEGHDEIAEGITEEDGGSALPPLAKGMTVACDELTPEQHFTKPPPRYTEASLVKKLEEEGIGRPSTYAPTISVIEQRGYIRKDGGKLFPQDIAFAVIDMLAEHFPKIVDVGFTAKMEQSLDDIAEGKEVEERFLRAFFDPFSALVERKSREISRRDVLPDRTLGTDPATGLPVIVRLGRFGPYVQLGRFDPTQSKDAKGKKQKKRPKAEEKLKTASLPKNVSLADVTFEQALVLLSFPRTLGDRASAPVTVFLGKFGPYVKCGELTASLPRGSDPATLTLAQACDLLAEREEGKKRAQVPLRELGKDPATGAAVVVKDGRYGPYVTDGKTNASLPKTIDPKEITPEDAFVLLAKKRAQGPRRAWRRKA